MRMAPCGAERIAMRASGYVIGWTAALEPNRLGGSRRYPGERQREAEGSQPKFDETHDFPPFLLTEQDK
jgi:hypothetical protein